MCVCVQTERNKRGKDTKKNKRKSPELGSQPFKGNLGCEESLSPFLAQIEERKELGARGTSLMDQ